MINADSAGTVSSLRPSWERYVLFKRCLLLESRANQLTQHVVDALHHRSTEFTELWKWRTAPEGKRNGIEEGEEGPRVLAKYRLANSEDWVF
jgi:hypothetical protein